MVLDWTLKLEKAGVLGEEMVFSEADRGKAIPVTQQFFIQNAGVVGNVGGHASVANTQSSHVVVNSEAIADLVSRVRPLLPALPEEVASRLLPVLSDLENSGSDQTKTRELLSSARTIAEGAAGNLVASGIVSAIGAILGA